MKSLFKSETFWTAVLQAGFGIAVVFESAYPGVGWLIMLKSVLDIVLRLRTVEPVKI